MRFFVCALHVDWRIALRMRTVPLRCVQHGDVDDLANWNGTTRAET